MLLFILQVCIPHFTESVSQLSGAFPSEAKAPADAKALNSTLSLERDEFHVIPALQ